METDSVNALSQKYCEKSRHQYLWFSPSTVTSIKNQSTVFVFSRLVVAENWSASFFHATQKEEKKNITTCFRESRNYPPGRSSSLEGLPVVTSIRWNRRLSLARQQSADGVVIKPSPSPVIVIHFSRVAIFPVKIQEGEETRCDSRDFPVTKETYGRTNQRESVKHRCLAVSRRSEIISFHGVNLIPGFLRDFFRPHVGWTSFAREPVLSTGEKINLVEKGRNRDRWNRSETRSFDRWRIAGGKTGEFLPVTRIERREQCDEEAAGKMA